MAKSRFKFIGRVGNVYTFQAPIPGDSRVDQVQVNATYFWDRAYPDLVSPVVLRPPALGFVRAEQPSRVGSSMITSGDYVKAAEHALGWVDLLVDRGYELTVSDYLALAQVHATMRQAEAMEEAANQMQSYDAGPWDTTLDRIAADLSRLLLAKS